MTAEPFRDRADAGRRLAAKLAGYPGRGDVLVLALPRGGVPVAFAVAEALAAPLDVFVVRKLGFPGHEEYAMGAIASGFVRVLNEDAASVPPAVLDRVTAAEHAELVRRERAYRGDRPPPGVRGRAVILIDDGLATGAAMRAAATALRQMGPARLTVAVPVASEGTCDEFRSEVDEIVCAITPPHLQAVGRWYLDFSQTTDDEVRDLLHRASSRNTPRREPGGLSGGEFNVR